MSHLKRVEKGVSGGPNGPGGHIHVAGRAAANESGDLVGRIGRDDVEAGADVRVLHLRLGRVSGGPERGASLLPRPSDFVLIPYFRSLYF